MGKSMCIGVVAFVCIFASGVLGQNCIPDCPSGETCIWGSCTVVSNCECAADPTALVLCLSIDGNKIRDEGTCQDYGCCWNSKKAACHTTNTLPPVSGCTVMVPPSERVNAGWKLITEEQCNCVGGCYDDSIKESTWCFYPEEEIDLGEDCEPQDECADPNASCINGVCACNDGYHEENGVCVEDPDIGDPCDAVDECKDPHAHCVEGICKCDPEYNERDGICQQICKQKILDIIFVVDSSGSIDGSEMATQKVFLSQLTQSFTISDSDTRVGLLHFASSATVKNNLNGRNTPADVQNDINNLPAAGVGSTNTGSGLNAMSNMFNTQGNNNQQMGFLLTDGQSNAGNLNDAINKIPTSVEMFTVGVDGANVAELTQIAGDPDHVYYVKEFDELIALIPTLREDLCPP